MASDARSLVERIYPDRTRNRPDLVRAVSLSILSTNLSLPAEERSGVPVKARRIAWVSDGYRDTPDLAWQHAATSTKNLVAAPDIVRFDALIRFDRQVTPCCDGSSDVGPLLPIQPSIESRSSSVPLLSFSLARFYANRPASGERSLEIINLSFKQRTMRNLSSEWMRVTRE